MEIFQPLPDEVERIGAAIIDAAIKVHRQLGPGLLESAYEQCLARELTLRGFLVERQVPISISYEGMTMEVGYRLDLLANGLVIVECKAVRDIHPVDHQQVLTHLRFAEKRLGYLINFNVTRLKDGISRKVV